MWLLSFNNNRKVNYVFGTNHYGQLGLGHCNNVITPTCLGLKALKAFCGAGYTFVIDINLDISQRVTSYRCFGYNYDGQLGLGDYISHNIPTKFNFMMKEIVDIKCSFHHTLILDIDGDIYSFGYQNNVPKKLKINNIDMQPLWQKIAVGRNHNLILDNEGFVYAFGRSNYYGQLGLGHTNNKVNEPTKIINLPCIVDILCFQDCSILLDINYKVWCFGSNKSGELGLDHIIDVNTPTIGGGLIGIVKLNDIRYKKTKSARNL